MPRCFPEPALLGKLGHLKGTLCSASAVKEGLVEEIEAEGRAERESKGLEPLGVEAILRQNPTTRPNKTKKSPAPRFHAASKAVRKGFWEAYYAFVAAFREAAEKLRAGDRSAKFPVGSFPPALPFVSPFPARPP